MRARCSQTLARPPGAAGWSRFTCTSGRRSRRSSRCGAPRAVVADVACELQRQGCPLEYVDLGGGLGISYDGARGAVGRASTWRALVDEVRRTGLPIVIEPGRSIVGPAGVLVARVIDLKPRDGVERVRRHRRRHDRADAAGALRRLSPHRAGVAAAGGRDRHYEIVGPVCESSDVVGRDRVLPPLEVGDLRRDPRRRRLRVGDGVELQSPPAAGRSAGRRRPLARHPPPPDGRRHARAGSRVMAERCWTLIAFEGLDQSGKQTQAELLRDRLKQDGRKARLVSFPDYGTSIGEEIARALQGEREYGPDVMQLLYVANRYERKAGPAALARGRADPRLRSLHGLEHRLRRGAGARPGVARRHAEVPAAAGADHPARHRAGDRRAAQGGRSRSLRARPRAAGARARELPAPGRRAATGSCSTASGPRTRSPPTSTPPRDGCWRLEARTHSHEWVGVGLQ